MPPERSLPGLLILSAGLLILANLLPGAWMQLEAAPLAQAAYWRLWTGQFCHWSIPHLLANLLAVAGLGWVAGRRLLPGLALLPLVAPLLSLGLLLVPELGAYRGSSGLVAFLLGTLVRDPRGPVRLLILGFGAKMLLDASMHTPSPFLPADIQTTWQAHLGGLLLGFAFSQPLPPPSPEPSR